MKKVILFTLFLGIFNSQAQDISSNYLDKVKTIDSTLETLYGVISGEKGEVRNWELFAHLFKPEAKLIPSGKDQDGTIGARFMSPDDYIKAANSFLVDNGFFEIEIHRITQTFGAITQVFSTYESYHSQSDSEPFMRGINSIQLLNDGNRWWVINIYWMQESPEIPIPKAYLPTTN